MRWQIYTRLVRIDGSGVGLRWFWRDPEGRESAASFVSRVQCEADASAHGYASKPEHDEETSEW